ncbi:MAG TPA: ATP synthase subunit I [Roseiarcus sp.]|nr:ATP synthase subunit I [Roseiarcus sp.]
MTAVFLLAAFAFGAALGTGHFVSLWWSVALMRENRTGLGVAAQAIRFALLAVALVLVARTGADLFLAAAAGVIVSRILLMRRARRLA